MDGINMPYHNGDRTGHHPPPAPAPPPPGLSTPSHWASSGHQHPQYLQQNHYPPTGYQPHQPSPPVLSPPPPQLQYHQGQSPMHNTHHDISQLQNQHQHFSYPPNTSFQHGQQQQNSSYYQPPIPNQQYPPPLPPRSPAPTRQYPPPLPPRSPAQAQTVFPPPPAAGESSSLKPSLSRIGARVAGFQSKLQGYLAKPETEQHGNPPPGPESIPPVSQVPTTETYKPHWESTIGTQEQLPMTLAAAPTTITTVTTSPKPASPTYPNSAPETQHPSYHSVAPQHGHQSLSPNPPPPTSIPLPDQRGDPNLNVFSPALQHWQGPRTYANLLSQITSAPPATTSTSVQASSSSYQAQLDESLSRLYEIQQAAAQYDTQPIQPPAVSQGTYQPPVPATAGTMGEREDILSSQFGSLGISDVPTGPHPHGPVNHGNVNLDNTNAMNPPPRASQPPTNPPNPAASSDPDPYDIHVPMLTTPMQMNLPGTSHSQPSRLCFGSTPAPHSRDYRTHPSAPSFLICTWCFTQHIQPSPLASAFPQSGVVRKSHVVCMFHVPRVTRSLWPAAVRSGDLGPLVEYMKRRTGDDQPEGDDGGGGGGEGGEVNMRGIKPCKGEVPTSFEDGIKWFSTRVGNEIPGFVACEACYEDFVLATPFGDRMEPYAREQMPGEMWGCDLANSYISRMLLRSGRCGDWAGFVQAAKSRLEMASRLSPCLGVRNVSDCQWWTLKGYGSKFARGEEEGVFIMCEVCYTDAIAGSRFETAFEPAVEKSLDGLPMWDQARMAQRLCGYKGNHPVEDAVAAAGARMASPGELRRSLEVIATKPRCAIPTGHQDGLFYNFGKGREVDEFDVCEACYVGTMTGFGLEQFLSEAPTRLPGTRYCVFHPAVNRWQQFVNGLNEALDVGAFTVYEEAVRKWADIPLCPRRDAVTNRRWYGWPDCTICPECFESFAAGTSLVKDMPLKNHVIEALDICSMYSPRQRGRYMAACESGNIEELLAATRERTLVWNQTVPKMTVLSAQIQSDYNASQLASIMAHSYRMSNAISFGQSTTEYRTSSGNVYQSYNGVMGEREQNESDRLFARAQAGDRSAQRMHLQMLWDEHE